MRRTVRCVALAIACVALFRTSIARCESSRHGLIVGQHVTVKPLENRNPLTARVVQLTVQTETDSEEAPSQSILTVRGQIESVDRSLSRFFILGHLVTVDEKTRAPSSISGIADFSRGQWVKLKIDKTESGQWHAQRIEVNKVERRTKIEGVIESVWHDSISVGGLVVLVPANVRIDRGSLTDSERLFTELITPQNPKEPGPWFSHGWIWSRGKIGINQRIENDFSIGDSTADQYLEAEPVLKVDVTARGPLGLSAFMKLRSRNTFVWKNAPLRTRPGENAVDLYEGYVLWRDILTLPVALQIGRQDFDDSREWIFDAQLDAIRLYAYPLYPITVEAAYINSLNDSPSNKFRTLSDFLIHAHGRLASSTEIGVYRLWRADEGPRGQEPIWTGVRWSGSYFGIRPWADIAWLRGWDKGRRFDASAYDLGATLTRTFGSRRLSVTASTARASGNDDDPKVLGVDKQFRQSGYEDNTVTYDGVTSFQCYGEIFDPELANLSIATLGCGLTLSPQASLDVVYHRYHQSEYSESVARDLEGTDLTVFDNGGRGTDPSTGRPVKQLFPYQKIGWELDLIVGMARIYDLFDVKWITGIFVPQDALSPPFWEQLPFKPKKRTSFFNQLSVEYRF